MDSVQLNGSAQSSVSAGGWHGISGSTIKIIAVAAMLIDHVAATVLERQITVAGYFRNGVIGLDGLGIYIVYLVMRLIGRLGFPIFCFLLVEGFQRTRNVKKYALRLGLFALISEVPFDLAFCGRTYYPSYQNVYFTLFFGLLALWGIDWIGKRGLPKAVEILLGAAAAGACMSAAHFLKTDYAATGVLTIIVMYLFRKKKVISMLTGCIVLTIMSFSEITAFFALIPIALYNGKRGLKMKYFFYGFYPVHLALLYLLCVLLGLGGVLMRI